MARKERIGCMGQGVRTRRQFLRDGASGLAAVGGIAAGLAPRGAAAQDVPVLQARAGAVQLAPEAYPATQIWGYDGQAPGPMIRVAQGARVQRRFENALPQASSVHWHGIRIENAMDGVVGLTQPAVPSGESFLYDFTVPDAGTYWYHPHNRTWEQMARGLYGALIVEEAEAAPQVDLDEVLLIDDWRLEDDAQIASDFGQMHDWAHGGRIGNWITVNASGAWGRSVAQHMRMRLRLVNTANARIFTLKPRGLAGWVVALDGMPLARPTPLEQLTLAPAQRADLIVDVLAEAGDEAFLVSQERGSSYVMASFAVEGQARAERLAEPAPLPANPVPELGPVAQAREVSLVMEGGAMGQMRGAMLGSEMLDLRGLVAAGKAWAFNGRAFDAPADMGRAPLIEAARGETIRVVMQNDTAWPHAMHLHGHHFRQIAADGTAGPLRDTLLMARGETAEIAFVADNPGDWLLHCHMLEHAAGGMMTWLRVL